MAAWSDDLGRPSVKIIDIESKRAWLAPRSSCVPKRHAIHLGRDSNGRAQRARSLLRDGPEGLDSACTREQAAGWSRP